MYVSAARRDPSFRSSLRQLCGVFVRALPPHIRERIAELRIPTVETLPEPRRSLGRGAVRERIDVYVPSRLLLQAIVTHRSRGAEAVLDVAGIENLLILHLVAKD